LWNPKVPSCFQNSLPLDPVQATNSTTLRMKTEMVFETSVSTKAEPHYPAENPKELLHENSLVRRENIKMRIYLNPVHIFIGIV
jgi:hypothetical protein